MTVCPDGQLNPIEAALAGDTVSEPTTFPFLSALNVPDCENEVSVAVLFDADGFLPPLLTHS